MTERVIVRAGPTPKLCPVGQHDFRLMLVQRGDQRWCFSNKANGFAYACSKCGARPT